MRTIEMPQRVDVGTVGEVEQMLRIAFAGGGRVELDCAQVRFVDSAGAKMLFQLADYATRHDCRVGLANLHDGPLRVLGLLGIFERYEHHAAD